jgi:hypothetical protein
MNRPFPQSDLSEPELCGVFALQKLDHRFICPDPYLRGQLMVAAPKRVRYLGFPRQGSSMGLVKGSQKLVLILEMQDPLCACLLETSFESSLGDIIQHKIDLAGYLFLRQSFPQGLLHEFDQFLHRLAVDDDLVGLCHPDHFRAEADINSAWRPGELCQLWPNIWVIFSRRRRDESYA